MNIYAVIILMALLVSYGLEMLSDFLTLNSLKNEPPEELKDVFDPVEYQKSQAYTRERIFFGFIQSTVSLIVLLTFWFAGGFNFLDQLLLSYGWSEIATGIAFISALLMGSSLIQLPFNMYSTFVIEEKFGFNKTSWSVFIADKIKGLILGAILGLPLLTAILWFFEAAGSAAWLYGWGVVAAFALVLQYVAPIWILPLFNKFTPLEEGTLKQSILAYAKSVEYPLKDISVMDGSKRSAKANAFFTGWGKNKRIALFDTMLEKYSVEEIVAVVAHEVGHFKLKHTIQGTVLSILSSGILFYLLSIFIKSPGLFEAFGMTHISAYAGLVFFGLLYTPIEMFLSILMNIFSRKHEYEADRYSADTTGHGGHLVSALKKLSVHNLTNLTPHPLPVFLYYSHPPLKDRIRALNK
jgi:STE24 endopeptidase